MNNEKSLKRLKSQPQGFLKPRFRKQTLRKNDFLDRFFFLIYLDNQLENEKKRFRFVDDISFGMTIEFNSELSILYLNLHIQISFVEI